MYFDECKGRKQNGMNVSTEIIKRFMKLTHNKVDLQKTLMYRRRNNRMYLPSGNIKWFMKVIRIIVVVD